MISLISDPMRDFISARERVLHTRHNNRTSTLLITNVGAIPPLPTDLGHNLTLDSVTWGQTSACSNGLYSIRIAGLGNDLIGTVGAASPLTTPSLLSSFTTQFQRIVRVASLSSPPT